MYYDVVALETTDNYQLKITFKDGKQGAFSLLPYLNFGVFRELEHQDYFKQAYIAFGAVAWPHGQDIAPSKLYDEAVAIGS